MRALLRVELGLQLHGQPHQPNGRGVRRLRRAPFGKHSIAHDVNGPRGDKYEHDDTATRKLLHGQPRKAYGSPWAGLQSRRSRGAHVGDGGCEGVGFLRRSRSTPQLVQLLLLLL